MKLYFIAVSLLLSLNANAAECFSRRSVRDWDVKDNTTLLIREGNKKQWQVKVFTCPDLRWADALAFDTRPRNSSFVCEGDKIWPLDGFGRKRSNFSCTIREIRRIR